MASSEPAPAPLTPADFEAIRAHPLFRRSVARFARENLAQYAALSLVERWAISDLGRTTASAAAVVLEVVGGLTARRLSDAVASTGVASPGRVRLYLERAIPNGLISPSEPDTPLSADTPLTASPRLVIVATQSLALAVEVAADLAPEAAAARPRLHEVDFRRRMSVWMGFLVHRRPDLFPPAGAPMHLFQARDGGTRMLEHIVTAQPPGGARLLESCGLSVAALARASFCSRPHVRRLLQEGAAQGLVALGEGRLTVSPELADDAEHYYAKAFAVARTAALNTLAA